MEGMPQGSIGIVKEETIIDLIRAYFYLLKDSGVDEETALDLAQEFSRESTNLVKIWPELCKVINDTLENRELIPKVSYDLKDVKLLPPIEKPSKIIGVALNYIDHAEETGREPPEKPMLFIKATSSIIGPNEPIIIPKHLEQVDYEAELVVVIGRKGRYIPEEDALNYVFGYTIGNDVSAREIQFGFPRHTLHSWAKSFDTFAPIGPWIVTVEDIDNPNNLDIELKINGETMQKSNTRNMIFNVSKLVSYISKGITLLPGDLIFTGTPAGVGSARKPPRFLKKGDIVEISIENIGKLVNKVEKEGEILDYW